MNEPTREKYLRYALYHLIGDVPALFLVAIVLCIPMPRGAGAANDP